MKQKATRKTLSRSAAATLVIAGILVPATAGSAHAESAKNYVCKASSSASSTDPGGRNVIATSRDKTNSTRFFRIEFISDGEHMYATNSSLFSSINYKAYFQGTGKEWRWTLGSGKGVHDNLDLPEGHSVSVNASPSVGFVDCGTNGGKT
ncbi:hypothetical protein ACIREO_03245 [Streptomyces sp. NPDC102441]|uniref:hypothetical protein n=1 Tax=Streptomyces sp. NPDC102441 TaxID=3366176 RepID=UPI00381383DB